MTVGCDLVGPRYCPFEAVPREQMATFLVRSTGLAPIAVTPATLFPVLSITDGDTFRAAVGGISEPVRLIGIDAREVGDCLSQAATDYLAALISGRSVRLVSDLSDRDQFDRLLRYVMVGGVFVNAELVRQGLATAVRYPPDTFMAPILEAAQAEAQAAGLGIWGREEAAWSRRHRPPTAVIRRIPLCASAAATRSRLRGYHIQVASQFFPPTRTILTVITSASLRDLIGASVTLPLRLSVVFPMDRRRAPCRCSKSRKGT